MISAEGHEPQTEAVEAAKAEVQPTLLAAVSGHCTSCGARLAADQRYCVDCGERTPDARPPVVERVKQKTSALAPSRRARRIQMSANSTLIAGVGTLLLALGVGVLIGRTAQPAAKNPAPVRLVTVPGAASATPTAATAGTTSSSGSSASKKSSSKHHKAAAATGSAKLPPVKKNLPPPTVKVGQTGSGAGYDKKTHKFTGNFFGQ